MTDEEVLQKCAAALHVPRADLGRQELGAKYNLIVAATDEEVKPNQMISRPGGSIAVVMPLTREEYDICREFNHALRRRRGKGPSLFRLSGDRLDLLRDDPDMPKEPPPDYHCYLCRELP